MKLFMMMKFILILLVLAISLSACSVGVEKPMGDPAIMSLITPTIAPTKVAVLVTATPDGEPRQPGSLEVTADPKNYPDLKPTDESDNPGSPGGMVPPLNEGGWQVIELEGFPFTFELPNNWLPVPDAQFSTWTPAGEAALSGRKEFSIRVLQRAGGQEVEALLPAGAVVEDRSEVTALGSAVGLYRINLGGEGAEKSFETHALVPDGSETVYDVSVAASTPEDRLALEDILLHALDTLR